MKIGYPCINHSVPCRGNRTFRLASYSPERLLSTVRSNLDCLGRILEFNAAHGILFFRISSDLVPFASHPVCTADWEGEFAELFAGIGKWIRNHAMRISMHPDQFVLINARDPEIIRRSVAELEFHARLMDALSLDTSAKIQIHVGGIYGDRGAAIARFCTQYRDLDPHVRRRLVIENDDRSYTLRDCLFISRKSGIPVLFDHFHNEVNPSGLPLSEALSLSARTWKTRDGIPMLDYSTQNHLKRKGTHADRLDPDQFETFLVGSRPFDFDLMLEIKEKERAALAALRIAEGDERLN